MLVAQVDRSRGEGDLQSVLGYGVHALEHQILPRGQVLLPDRRLGEAVNLKIQTGVAEIGEMNEIDLAVLPIGDNFTMGIDDAVKATEFLKPANVIPMHYKTFDVIEVDPQEFVNKVKEKGFKAEVLVFGGSIDF